MGLINALSDYGSGASMDLMSPWSSRDQIQWPSFTDPTTVPPLQREKRPRPSSYLDLVARGTASSWDARADFDANGIDTPYGEDYGEHLLQHHHTPADGQTGFYGRTRALRQTSCPERIPGSTRPVSWIPSPTAKEFIPLHTQNHQTKEFYQEFLPTTSIDYNYHQNEFKKDFYEDLEVQINSFRLPGLDVPSPARRKSRNDLGLPMEVDLNALDGPMMPEHLTPLATSTPIDYKLTTPLLLPRPIRGADDQGAAKVCETTSEVTSEQLRVLSSLPDCVVEALLRQLSAARDSLAPHAPPQQPQPAHAHPPAPRRKAADECRFCKNNGERESYYQSHALKDARGRVVCPVLQAFVCHRCGATGPKAHTAKYCPMASSEERQKSAAMMRSVINASSRRRHSLYATSNQAYNPSNLYDQSSNLPSNLSSNLPSNSFKEYVLFDDRLPPLDPSWVELEKKLTSLISS